MNKAEYTAALPAPTDTPKIFSSIDKLIITMLGLRTDFPEATLHDCTDKDEANDNRVFGQTALEHLSRMYQKIFQKMMIKN
jgi:hypothetical protein